MSEGIAGRIRAAVAAIGSQAEAAARLGVSRSTLSGWATGKYEPPLPVLARILGLAKVSANELLGLPEPKPDRGTIDKDGEHFDTLSSASGRVGAGPAILDAQEGRRYAFHLDWLKKQPSRGKHLRMVWVDKRFGDSMIPTIHPGSMLAVDLGPGGRGYSELGPHDGKVFLVRPEPEAEHGGMVVKRVYLQDGNLVLLSDNPTAKPRLQVIPIKKRPLQQFLLGRVVHVARDEE